VIIQLLILKDLTEFDFHPTLARTEGLTLVLFSSPTCGSCRAVEKRLPKAAEGSVTDVFKIDVQQSTGLARAFDVFHLPALFLFVEGHFHAQLKCEIAPAKLQQAIEDALAMPAEEEP
jgi:thioredoxin 1